MSEYRNEQPFSYTDGPLYREGLVTRGRYAGGVGRTREREVFPCGSVSSVLRSPHVLGCYLRQSAWVPGTGTISLASWPTHARKKRAVAEREGSAAARARVPSVEFRP